MLRTGIALLLALVASPALAQERIALVAGGMERQALLLAVRSPAPRPLLILLHGRFGSGAQVIRSSGLNPGAGFILAAPDGVQRSWADGRGATPADRMGVDDVGFLRALVATIAARHRLDPSRIYVAGHSNGGFMAARMGCEAADMVAGIAMVAASVGQSVAMRCRPARPVSALLIAGTADPLVPFGGGIVRDGGPVLAAEAATRLFAARVGCGAGAPRALPHAGPPDGTSARMTDYAPCPGGTRVALIAILGGGHGWPGGATPMRARMAGPPSGAVEASAEIRRFFALGR